MKGTSSICIAMDRNPTQGGSCIFLMKGIHSIKDNRYNIWKGCPNLVQLRRMIECWAFCPSQWLIRARTRSINSPWMGCCSIACYLPSSSWVKRRQRNRMWHGHDSNPERPTRMPGILPLYHCSPHFSVLFCREPRTHGCQVCSVQRVNTQLSNRTALWKTAVNITLIYFLSEWSNSILNRQTDRHSQLNKIHYCNHGRCMPWCIWWFMEYFTLIFLFLHQYEQLMAIYRSFSFYTADIKCQMRTFE
jgi:hypothetical protein